MSDDAALRWAPVGVLAALAFVGSTSPSPTGIAVTALGAVSLVPLLGWLRILSFLPVAAAGLGAIAAALVLSAGQAVPLALLAASLTGAAAGAAIMAVSPGDRAGDTLVSLVAAVVVWGVALPLVSVTGTAEVLLLGVDLSSDRALAVTATALTAAAVWAASHVARSALARGAVVITLDPSTAARSGVDTRSVRLQSGMLAGTAAAWAGLILTLDAQTLPAVSVLAPAVGVTWLVAALLGGRFWLPGVLMGALVLAGMAPLIGLTAQAAAGVAVVAMVLARFDGLAALARPRGSAG